MSMTSEGKSAHKTTRLSYDRPQSKMHVFYMVTRSHDVAPKLAGCEAIFFQDN